MFLVLLIPPSSSAVSLSPFRQFVTQFNALTTALEEESDLNTDEIRRSLSDSLGLLEDPDHQQVEPLLEVLEEEEDDVDTVVVPLEILSEGAMDLLEMDQDEELILRILNQGAGTDSV